MNEWIKIRDLVVTDDIQQVHCDTRDFCAFATSDSYDDNEKATLPWWSVRNDSRFLVAQDEIVQLLCRLEEMTGGEGEWRMMNFKNIKTKTGWFKYVRLYRVSPTHFIVTDGTYAANISHFTESNLEKEFLCFR